MSFLDKAKGMIEEVGDTAKRVERQAQIIANATAKAKLDKMPDLSVEGIKKIKYDALQEARAKLKGEQP